MLHITDPDGDTVIVETGLFAPEGHVALSIDAGASYTPLTVYVTPEQIAALADAAQALL